MTQMFKRFLKREDGAVTVDWVVLTAAIVGLAAGAGGSMLDATNVLSAKVSSEVGAKTVDNGN